MPAHAVGDDVKTQRIVDQERVFVAGSFLTDVGGAERSDGLQRSLYRSMEKIRESFLRREASFYENNEGGS
jgi:hypothetical protein